MNTIVLTIHNKAFLLPKVLDGIFNNATEPFEFIAVIDGCTDDSLAVTENYLLTQKNKNLRGFQIIIADDVFETKANNMAAKSAKGDYAIIIQDDCEILQANFIQYLTRPFQLWDDVFAVSGNCAHSWKKNENSVGQDANGWSDVLIHYDHANKTNTEKGILYIRQSVNRSPLAINLKDMRELGYFDEIFAPLGEDEHDLNYKAKAVLKKVCGYVNIDTESKPEWGGTRDSEGKPKQFMLAANRKNAPILLERHGEAMKVEVNEERIIN